MVIYVSYFRMVTPLKNFIAAVKLCNWELHLHKFKEGYFTARHSDYLSSRILTEETIEQTLMESMSVEGGPFKRGVTESIVCKWIKGVIYTKDILEEMEDFSNISFKKSY